MPDDDVDIEVVGLVPCPQCGGTGYTVRLDGSGLYSASGPSVRVRCSKEHFTRRLRELRDSPPRRNALISTLSRWARQRGLADLAATEFSLYVVGVLTGPTIHTHIMEEPCQKCGQTGWNLRLTRARYPQKSARTA